MSEHRWLNLNRPQSLAGRLMLWYALTTVALALTATVIIYWGLSWELRQGTDNLLLERVQVLRALLREGAAADAGLRWEVESEWEGLEHHDIFLRILDPNQSVVVETRQLAPRLPAGAFPAPAGPEMPLRGRRIHGPSGGEFQVMSAEAAGPAGDGVFVIQAAFDLGREGQVLDRFKLLLVAVVVFSALLSLVFGYRITRSGLRPVEEIVETTRRIGGCTLDERIHVENLPPELASLADNVNAMLERLGESFARLSRFSADVAHELRTPLNNLRGEAEVALGRPRTPEEYREVLASSLEECGSLATTIDRLLFIAQAERSEAPIVHQQVSVATEFRRMADYYEPVLAEKGLDLQMECQQSLALEADRELFRRAVGNLVANSLAFTPRGGAISLCAERRDGTIRVQVQDTGIGIPAEHLPHVLDRFYRVEGTRHKGSGGSGLGLSIVKAVMDLHAGSLEISSRPGNGTIITLVFPNQTES